MPSSLETKHRVRGGIIAISHDGQIVMRFNTDSMARAAADSQGRHEVIVAQPASDQQTEAAPDYRTAIARLQAAVQYEVASKDLPAVSIALVDRDLTVWADGFGYQDAAREIPATADTVYRVGSVSKLFTDIAVMQLVESGDLDIDKPVSHYLPNFQPQNPYRVPLTLRQLMSHQSGLVRESPVGNYFDPDEPSLEETVASLNQTKLVYPPNTRTKYSNAAVAVVGAVLEGQLPVTHPQQVRNTILQPLNMTASDFVVSPDIQPHLATGWMRTYDERRFSRTDVSAGHRSRGKSVLQRE